MGITVNTSPQQITASVGETKIDVSVSGGIGPTGPAGEVGGGYTLPVATNSVLGGVRGGGAGITIAANGVISATAASVNWSDITGKPSTFTPAAHSHVIADVTGLQTALDGKQASGSYAAASHASTHATGGADEIAGILDNWVLWDSVTNTANGYSAGDVVIHNGAIYYLTGAPSSNGEPGDVIWPQLTKVVVSVAGKSGAVTLDAADVGAASVSHTHGAADLNFAATDRLLGRSSAGAGAGQEIVCTAFGRSLIDDADASAARTTLGLGTAATSNTGDFAAASHNQAWSTITSTPTTRSGYGITDAQKTITSGTAAPTGGSDGDIYLQYT